MASMLGTGTERREPDASAQAEQAAMAALAQRTARRFGYTPLRWWQNPRDPRVLFIEARHPFSTGKPLTLLFEAIFDPQELLPDTEKQPADNTFPTWETSAPSGQHSPSELAKA